MNPYNENEFINRLASWWRRLDEGVSSSSPIMDALYAEFGDVVNSQDAYELTDDSLGRIFDVLNAALFENLIIKKPRLAACGKSDILRDLKRMNPEDFDPAVYSHVFVGMFYSTYDILHNGVKVEDLSDYKYDGSEEVVFGNETIFINLSEAGGFGFMSYVNCIAHEMIHCFDEYLGSTKQRLITMNMFGCKIDSHTTDMFLEKQAEANGNGLNIVDRLFESGRIYGVMSMKDAMEKCRSMKPIKYRLIRDHGKLYVDMQNAPDLNTDIELHVTVGPHTRALIQF